MDSSTAICWPGRTRSPSLTSTATIVPCSGAGTGTEPAGPAVADAATVMGGRLVVGRDAGFDQRRLRRRLGLADQISDMGLDEAGADTVLDKIRMRQNRRQEGDVGGDAADPELAQRARGLVHDVGPVTTRRMHDDLGEQRVEGGAGAVPRVTKRIDANAGAGRQVEQRQRPAGWLCPAGLVHHLHVDAELHRIAARLWDIGLRQTERAQRGAGRDRELRLHEIEAEHLLGDGMLDLEPRIGLDEGERLIACLVVIWRRYRRGIRRCRGCRSWRRPRVPWRHR